MPRSCVNVQGAANFMFNFNVKDAEIRPNGSLFVVIPVTEAEMTTMKELLRVRHLGFDFRF